MPLLLCTTTSYYHLSLYHVPIPLTTTTYHYQLHDYYFGGCYAGERLRAEHTWFWGYGSNPSPNPNTNTNP